MLCLALASDDDPILNILHICAPLADSRQKRGRLDPPARSAVQSHPHDLSIAYQPHKGAHAAQTLPTIPSLPRHTPASYPPKALLNPLPSGIYSLHDLRITPLVGMMLAGRVFVGLPGLVERHPAP